MENKFVHVLGIPFLHTTEVEMIQRVVDHVQREEKAFIVTANPEIVMYAKKNPEYERTILKANYVIADGIGIVKGAGLLGTPLPERVAGVDLFKKLLRYANEKEKRVYFLGAKERVLEQTIIHVEKYYPNLTIVGKHHGYFELNSQDVLEDVKKSKADFIFVALGFPRQEQWIVRAMDEMDKGVFMGVGGSFDVLAGNVKRAPVLWQRLHIEWLYRLISQPTRWRRMLVLPYFVKEIRKGKKNER